MNDWQSPIVERPPQGMKVLCFEKGDVYVAQRFKDYWFPIPFLDSKFALKNPPQLWKYIDLPHPYTGKMLVVVDEVTLDIDELEAQEPDLFNNMLFYMLETFKGINHRE